MTKEGWKKVEEAATNFFSTVYLKADEYDIAFKLVRVSAYKNEIAIYIGEVFKGEWLTKDCEERRRFCQKKVHSLLTPKGKTYLKKLSKKKQKEFMEKYPTQYEEFSPYWSSFGALKKHLIANNQNIELVKIG